MFGTTQQQTELSLNAYPQGGQRAIRIAFIVSRVTEESDDLLPIIQRRHSHTRATSAKCNDTDSQAQATLLAPNVRTERNPVRPE
jgi:hypothetical protein